MKKTALLSLALIAAVGLCFAPLVGCKSTLEPGGAYAPAVTNVVDGVTNVVATAAPDKAFYAVDSAFLLAYSATDAVFAFERNNRQFLWELSPEIKHTVDKIRPEAVAVRNQYAAARAAYIANPTPAGLSQLEEALAQANRISSALQSVLPKK